LEDQFNSRGIDDLRSQHYKVDPGLREFERENTRLKKIIARHVQELEVRTELLKKLNFSGN